MELQKHLSLRTPLLWITTEEPGRVIDKTVETAERLVFRMDALTGFIQWSTEKRAWVQVLIRDEESGGELMPVNDMNVALSHVLETRGIMILENAHKIVEGLFGFLLSVSLEYRKAFYNDDKRKVPAQFIMLSHTDEIPNEISRTTTHLIHELPDSEELNQIITHMGKRLTVEENSKLIARAGLGLSETEFVSASLLSHKEHGIIKAADVNAAKMDLLKKNGILEVRKPNIHLEDLGGLDHAKQLISDVAWVWNNPDEAKELGIESLRRIMFVGVPGTGKSLICEAISSRLELELAKGGVSNAMNKFVGESEANMRRMFASLKRMAPIVFWIDEFGRDMSGGMSSGSVDGGTTDRVHGEFLTGVQELPDNIFLAAAANRIEDLPPEMLRADRFDRIMFVGFPTQREREAIFRIHLGEQHEQYDLKRLAEATQFFTGAEIKALIREVRFNTGTRFRRIPDTAEIVDYIPQVKGRVWVNHRESIVAMYQRAKVEWVWASSAQQMEADTVLSAAGALPSTDSKAKASASYAPKTAPKTASTGFQVPKGWG